MYEYIKGELTVKKIEYVAIDINGLAYKLSVSLKTFDKLVNVNEEEKLFIYTNVKEDNISFYGFKTENERELFKSLVSISGVGPKLAIAILSTYETRELIDIVLNDEAKLLTKVPGLGEKKSQKLILDLKDKVKKLNIIEMYNEDSEVLRDKKIISTTMNTNNLLFKEDVKLALESLGYTNVDVSKWLKDDEIEKITRLEDAIKEILKKIHNKK